MSGQVKQQGPSSWVWNKGTSEADAESGSYEVDVEFEDLGDEETPNLDPLLYWEKNAGPSEPEHTIPPLDPESALAKCHALIQEQASELGEEMLARVEAEEKAEFWVTNWELVLDLHEKVSAECKSLKQQLKTMTEDRDEYQAKYQTERSIVESWADENWRMESIYNALVLASVDEQMMVLTYAQKLMGEGRSEHGPLDLATDDRDLLGEGLDELDDVMSYLMMVKRRLELRRKGDSLKPCPDQGCTYWSGHKGECDEVKP